MPDNLSVIEAAITEHSEATRLALAEIRGQVAGADGRVRELELAYAKMGTGAPGPGNSPAASLAREVEADAGFVSFRDRKSDRAMVPVSARALLEVRNTITSAITGGTMAQADRDPNIHFGPQRKKWLFELMPQLPATAGNVEYVRESGYTNSAAPQSAEGAAKAESALTFALKTAPVPTIAHFVKASRQALSDSPALGRHLDVRLRYGLLTKLEDLMINGDGTGGGMTGLTHAGNFTAYTGGMSGDTGIDTLRRALAQLENGSFQPDGILLNPIDWADLELIKDQNDRYITGDPRAPSPTTIWSTIVFPTPSVAQGAFIAGAFGQCTTFYNREDASLRLSDSADDNFTKNLVTALAELRALSVVNVPEGIIVGDLTELS